VGEKLNWKRRKTLIVYYRPGASNSWCWCVVRLPRHAWWSPGILDIYCGIQRDICGILDIYCGIQRDIGGYLLGEHFFIRELGECFVHGVLHKLLNISIANVLEHFEKRAPVLIEEFHRGLSCNRNEKWSHRVRSRNGWLSPILSFLIITYVGIIV
jgi:hypothetical protein